MTTWLVALILCVLLLCLASLEVKPRRTSQTVEMRRWPYKAALIGLEDKNSDGTFRGEIVKSCRRGEPLVLLSDPLSGYGENAMAVFRANGQQIGFINTYFLDTSLRSPDLYAEIDEIALREKPRVTVRLTTWEEAKERRA